MNLSFKRFISEDMDPSPDKTRDVAMGNTKSDDNKNTQDYFSGLSDEQNIEWGDLTKALTNEPWVSSHFGLGKPNNQILYKLAAWEIVKGSLTPEGADIRLKAQKGNRSYLHGNRLNKSKYEDDKRYHLNREELIRFLTTGWTPQILAAQQGSGGGMGGPPM